MLFTALLPQLSFGCTDMQSIRGMCTQKRDRCFLCCVHVRCWTTPCPCRLRSQHRRTLPCRHSCGQDSIRRSDRSQDLRVLHRGEVRMHFKVAFLNEFRKDVRAALTFYIKAGPVDHPPPSARDIPRASSAYSVLPMSFLRDFGFLVRLVRDIGIPWDLHHPARTFQSAFPAVRPGKIQQT